MRDDLRNNASLFIPGAKTCQVEKFPLFNFPKVWKSFTESSLKSLETNENLIAN